MEQQERLRRLGWFLPLRLTTYVILMAVVAVWMGYPRYLQFQVVGYSICTLAFTLAFAFERRFSLTRVANVLVAIQFLLEISLEGGIIYATGNVNSPFSALFLLTIVSAALAYRMMGTTIIASLVSLAYTFIIWLGLSQSADTEMNMQALRTIFASQDDVFYSIFLHILIFFLIAFISGYLAERLSSQDKRLADASHALKLARLETDDILRHVSSGLLTIDSEGHIIYFNHAAERILGYREEEVRGLGCQQAFAERMPVLAQRLTEGILHGIEHPRGEIEIINAERVSIPLGLSTSILMGDNRQVRGVIAIFSDLTDAKALEAKVRTADRLSAVGELSASIAHEIRNPLAAISGSVEVLNNELQLTGENGRLMNLILKESQRLNTILTNFLSYARIDRPTYDKVDLCHIISEVIELLYHQGDYRNNVRISFDSPESIVYVVGDANLFKQLLMNLMLNACEAFEGNRGEVVVKLESQRSSRTLILSVSDDGPGIPEGQLEKVFQPFYSTKKHGTGLGLAIVHRICTALHVTASVQSRVGQGTTFTLELERYSQSHSLPASRERGLTLQLAGAKKE